MNMKSPHHQTAFSIVTSNANVLLDDEPLDDLIDNIASALQDAFDLGFKAAAFEINPFANEPPATPAVGGEARYRHKKRGSVYRVLHEGTMSTSEIPRMDDEPMVVYQCETDSKIWVRPVAEFYDGRFEELPALTAAPAVGGETIREVLEKIAGALDTRNPKRRIAARRGA